MKGENTERRQRKQQGQIIQIGPRWYVRYYVRRTVAGAVERNRVTHLLGPITTRGKTPPAEIEQEAERHMSNINNYDIPLSQVVSIVEFVESVFLPVAEKRLKPSTYHNYKGDWERRIRPLVARDRKRLNDYKTFHIQGWLNHIAQDGTLSKNSLRGVKALVSAVFKEARRLGYYNATNPAQDTRISSDAAEPRVTYAYDLEEIATILATLPEPAATIFAVAAYSGLRRGEIEGLQWADYKNGELTVRRSIWNGEVLTPKTEKSCAAVPVIRPLAERLEMHRLRCDLEERRRAGGGEKHSENPQATPIFSTANGTPLSLHNVVNRQILPVLNRCVVCGLSEGLPHLKAKEPHDYERDSRIPEWQGFHAGRRGLGSNLYRLGIHELVIQRILRHSNVATTTTYYIKSTPADVSDAMAQLEKSLPKSEGQTFQDSNRTVKSDSGAMPGFVN